MSERLFHRYNPHETITFLSYEKEKRRIAYLDGEGREMDTVLQNGISFDIESVNKGDRLRVQYGTITNGTSAMMGGTRWNSHHIKLMNGQVRTKYVMSQIYTDGRCINAIGHDAPKVELSSLLLMERFFGSKEVRRHLSDFKAGASTKQTEIQVKCGRRKPNFNMSMNCGILYASGKIADRIYLGYGTITVQEVGLSETVLTSLPGRRLADLVAIPGWMHDDLVIQRAQPDMDAIRVHLRTRLLSVEEALDRIADPVALAA